MKSTDAFALKNSDLNAFLYAVVGTELNGSTLTMLSVLARLGQDPWVEAARWTALPKAEAMNCVARSIGEMPLEPRDLAKTNATASRLLLLLPAPVGGSGPSIRAAVSAAALSGWIPIALLCAFLLIGLAFSMNPNPAVSVSAALPHVPGSDQATPITPK